MTSTDKTAFAPPRVARHPVRGAKRPASEDFTRPLKVILVSPPYYPVPPDGYGGVEAVLADLADSLVARGHSVTLLGVGEPRTSADFVPVWDRTFADQLGEVYPEVAHAAAVRREVARIAATNGVDLVHDHTFAGPLNAPVYAESRHPHGRHRARPGRPEPRELLPAVGSRRVPGRDQRPATRTRAGAELGRHRAQRAAAGHLALPNREAGLRTLPRTIPPEQGAAPGAGGRARRWPSARAGRQVRRAAREGVL